MSSVSTSLPRAVLSLPKRWWVLVIILATLLIAGGLQRGRLATHTASSTAPTATRTADSLRSAVVLSPVHRDASLDPHSGKDDEVVEFDGSLDSSGDDDDPYAFHEALTTPDPGDGIRPSMETIVTAADDEPVAAAGDDAEPEAPERDYSSSERVQKRNRERLAAIAHAMREASPMASCAEAPDATAPLDSRALPDHLRASFTMPRFEVLSYDTDARHRFAVLDGVRINEGGAIDTQTTLLHIEPRAVLVSHHGCLIRIASRRP